ncbi:MAG TPA: response regulator transcription factor [Pedobacter sp.]|uniref:LytR/AlgR family response regulator transcription factor n=1 Tax=Pedobacter sp. TaxID=1411316 RepID=UPI002CB1CCAC|nr:response regulator transcription factor [Pedobacter sp.]HMI02846.1 response regulator transcription factor [Pedobacter sp.]
MIRCLIVDDERLARELIADNIRLIPFLELAGSCKNALEAMEILRTEAIDLVFLDIQMQGISGIQLLQGGLIDVPMVIMVTAYENYALEAFNLDVLDYLMKPVPFERFFKAVSKARDQYLLKRKQPAEPAESQYVFVNSEYSLIRIDIDQITYVEGLKDYIKIYQMGRDKPVIPRLSLHYMEEKLPAGKFLRVHRSYIVALDKILSVRKNRLFVEGAEVPFTENYREGIMRYIEQRNF